MEENYKRFIDTLCNVVESNVLSEGWINSEEDMKKLLMKEKLVTNFKKAFNDAVLMTFRDSLNDINVPKMWNKSYEAPMYSFLESRNCTDSMKLARITSKLNEKHSLQSLIETELQFIQLLKPTLQFMMAKIYETKTDFNNLVHRIDSVSADLEKSNGLLLQLNNDLQ